MAKKQNKFNPFLTFVLCVVFAVFGVVAGGYGYFIYKTNEEISKIHVYSSGEITFHFLELGNVKTGDCTYIKAGEIDILIDAGSNTSSIPTITSYINNHILDNKLEYVIVTHAHEDHYAGFATEDGEQSIFDKYDIGTIIDFSQTNQTKGMYLDYLRERTEAINKGAVHYTAKECVDGTNGATSEFDLGHDITLTVLNQKYYHEKASSGENNHSVCTLFSQGENNHFLFTGDLEKSGEKSLAGLNDLPHCKLYKAGHHGSKTSSHDVLLNEITPEICTVCCCAGSDEYTDINENQFPTQEFIDRISKHTDKVYVTTLYKNETHTSMNGNIVVMFKGDKVDINCSNNNTLLKDTDWFKQNRTCKRWAS